MEKRWLVKPVADRSIIDQFPELNNIIVQLLFNRGLTSQAAIDDFLNPSYDDHSHSPFLFSDMEQAVGRIFAAIRQKEKIMIYGDYDADGVCASAILFSTLKAFGADVDIYIPFRDTEGYGLNQKVVKRIINQGFQLLITVDCGIANKEEIEILNQGGVAVIVTDHHQEPPTLPQALAIINPMVKNSGYPFPFLSGAGVAFKLCQALAISQEQLDFPVKLPAGFEKWLMDLVAIATIGDIMPLIGENRVLVKYGLIVLNQTRRPGLQKLIEATNGSAKIDSQYVGWRIVPRLNAAGRINHASVAFDLLTTDSVSVAAKLVDILEKNNKDRQNLTDKILREADKQVIEQVEKNKILWAVGDDWPTGILGLVAGRLCDRHHRPVLAVSRQQEATKKGGKYVGSGRSISVFDITAALKKNDHLLERYGGHSQACGFSVSGQDNFLKFQDSLSQLANQAITKEDLKSIVDIDADINLEEVNWNLVGELEKFAPFGEGNLSPLFLIRQLNIEQLYPVGNDGQHLKVIVSQNGSPAKHKLIGFSFGDWCAKLKVGDKIDIVFELGVNEWNGNRELQLKLMDLRLSS